MLEPLLGARKPLPTGTVVFVGSRFAHLIAALRGRVPIAILNSGFQDVRRARAWNLRFVPEWTLHQGVERAKSSDVEASLDRLWSRLAARLARLNPRALVFSNDMMPFERTLIAAAQRAGIPTLTIQDGMFFTSWSPELISGWRTDAMLVWTDYLRRFYAASGILAEDRVHVLGFPFPTISAGTAEEPATVCFLGSPCERYGEQFMRGQDGVTELCRQACSVLGRPFVYRPHPGEDRGRLAAALPQVVLTPTGEPLAAALSRYGTFVSIGSTALLEAAMAGRAALQVTEPHFKCDRFEDLGICGTVEPVQAEVEAALRVATPGGQGTFAAPSAEALADRFREILDATTGARCP